MNDKENELLNKMESLKETIIDALNSTDTISTEIIKQWNQCVEDWYE